MFAKNTNSWIFFFCCTISIIKSWDEKFVMHAYSSYKCFNTLHLYRSLGGASLWKPILFKTHCFFATWLRTLIKDFFWVYIFLATNVKVSNEFLIQGWELILMLMQKTMFCDIFCTKKHSSYMHRSFKYLIGPLVKLMNIIMLCKVGPWMSMQLENVLA